MASSVDNASPRDTDQEVAATIVHMKKLLRLKNQLRSPLLRLPTEIIVRILSFIMADLALYRKVWIPVYGTCHRIHRVMCSATELWWTVDCAYERTAHFIFLRSKGSPRVLLSDLRSLGEDRQFRIERRLDHWRDRRGFRGHRLETFQFCGPMSTFYHFAWILQRSLPRVDCMKINIIDSLDDDDMEPLPNPVALELPVDMPLRLLDLRNVTLSWPSHSPLFNGLRELRLSFRDCDRIITIPEDELFGIFDASPQLEHLSLLQVGHEVPLRNGKPLPPKRILQFPNLVSLSLDNDPVVTKYTLAYMGLPVINTLKIRSFISWDVAHNPLDLFFPDDRLQTRLFSNPSRFAVRTVGLEGANASIEMDIGSVELRLDFPLGQGVLGRGVIMSCISHIVPPSVIALNLEYTELEERGWRDFFISHPEVQSIESTEFHGTPPSSPLWDALLPTGEEGADVPCPRLESILLTLPSEHKFPASLSNCLRNRQTAGFKLRRLKMVGLNGYLDDVEEFHEELRPLVEIVEARGTELGRRVGAAAIRYPDVH